MLMVALVRRRYPSSITTFEILVELQSWQRECQNSKARGNGDRQ